MESRKDRLRFNFKVWIETEEKKGILGYGQMRLLQAIKDKGTLNNAIRDAGFHYRKSWDKLKTIESLLGFRIIETHRGGANKGNTVLTEKGHKLIDAFEKFNSRYEEILKKTCETATNDLLNDLQEL